MTAMGFRTARRGRFCCAGGFALLLGVVACGVAPSGAAARESDAPIAAGGNHTCALTGQGGVRCWGDNTFGELGDGTKELRVAPVQVKGLSSGVESVSPSGYHTCATLETGGVKCWGDNSVGELGDGTR